MRLAAALATPGLGAIAEVKRRSPSAGELRPDADPAALAADFERAGAAACSILVDDRFGGSIADLAAARSASEIPLLAKGFFSRADQLAELRRAGADAVLLLLRDLEDGQVEALSRCAAELGMDTLVEAHDADELDRALLLGVPVIGVNARDLSTFRIDRQSQLGLVARAAVSDGGVYSHHPRPDRPLIVAESGIDARAHAAAAELAGADAVLVGSTLMRAVDPGAKLGELLRRPLVKVCGLTRQDDVDVAAQAGADLAGFILARESPRRAAAVLDVPDTMLSVAVFVGETEETTADLVQLHRREDGHRSREATLLRDGVAVAHVLDQPWHGSDPAHWAKAARAEGRVMLAGGLSPENVRAAIETVRPWAVDASSSLELEPGVKDHARVRAYVEAAAQPLGREGGPAEGVRGNREAPPSETPCP